jgi:ubiquinone/menaquinone biosynthesis C-methylase UbiE
MSSYKKKVEQSYDRTSSTYDDMMNYDIENPNIQPTYKQLFDGASIPDNPIALDIGCGTGISTFELVKECNRKGQFYGVDLSQQMIERAKNTANSYHFENCIFSQGDAEELDFPDSTFDLVTSCYTYHFLPDKLKALSEMHRVLEPNGTLALLYHGKSHIIEVLSIFMHLEERFPEYFEGVSWDEVNENFISLERSHELFTEAGFHYIRTYAIHEIDYVEPSRFIAGLDTVFSFWQEDLPSNIVLDLKNELIREMEKTSTDMGFKRTRYDVFAYGKRPK